MLGSLAKWLRIFGFDTFYPKTTMDDDSILQIAHSEQRLLISRDKELLMRAKKALIPVLEIHTTDLTEQLRQVLKVISLEPEKILTRCTVCNAILHPMQKETIKEHLPKKVYETKNEFWTCPVCSRYYWKGTHYENMCEKINTLKPDSSS